MSLNLATINIPANVVKQGRDDFTMSAGGKLKIKNGEDYILNETVPDGKTWRVSIQVRIDEDDA